MNKNPNPQGKGLTPVLDSLRQSQALVVVPPKDIHQVSSELFTSLFVLHSQFHFRPVVGKVYYLYQQGSCFKLSLISPEEWGGEGFGRYVGECILQTDITWTLNLCEAAASDPLLMNLIARRREEFERELRDKAQVNEALPFYLGSLPFYQRIFAAGLAGSLRSSMLKSGILGLSYSQAQE